MADSSRAVPAVDSGNPGAQQLRQMRMLATGLLILMAVVYAATHHLASDEPGNVWGYVHAASEAGMVGAIADWFAVTALFRHPLGIPIPHTAIIPRRKQALGRSLERFVAENFLTPGRVGEQYRQAQVARRLGQWLTTPGNSERLVVRASPMIARGLGRIDRADLEAFVEQTAVPRLREEEVGPAAGVLLAAVVHDGAHRGVVDIAAHELHRWVESHPSEIQQMVRARAPQWSPQWLDDRVVVRAYQEARRWAKEIATDEDHHLKQACDSYLSTLAHDLQHDPDTRERAERLKEHVLANPQTAKTGANVTQVALNVLREALAEEAGQLQHRLAQQVRSAGESLLNDAQWCAAVDRWGAEAVEAIASRYGAELSTIISATIEQWDGKEAAARIEQHVGRDLQFIRINGTVVGALVGLLLHLISLAL